MSLRQLRVIFATLAVLFMLVAAPSASHAQAASGTGATTSAPDAPKRTIPADFKGIVGVGLIGAEIGAVLPAVAGLKQTWAYLVFPAIGAAGGAVLGYYALEQSQHTELAVASLMLGSVLLIPTLVITLTETSYDPSEDTQSAARKQERALAVAKARRAAELGTGMLRVSEQGVALATPGFGLVPGVPSAHDRSLRISGLSLSLLSGRF